MSCRRNGFRKEIAEATEGPLELRRKRGKENAPGGRGSGEVRSCFIERALRWVFCLRVFIWRSQGKIPKEYAGSWSVLIGSHQGWGF